MFRVMCDGQGCRPADRWLEVKMQHIHLKSSTSEYRSRTIFRIRIGMGVERLAMMSRLALRLFF
jgi:hypothetical protein